MTPTLPSEQSDEQQDHGDRDDDRDPHRTLRPAVVAADRGGAEPAVRGAAAVAANPGHVVLLVRGCLPRGYPVLSRSSTPASPTFVISWSPMSLPCRTSCHGPSRCQTNARSRSSLVTP